MVYLKLIVSIVVLLISYFVRTYTALSLKTYDTNRPPCIRSGIGQFIALVIWVGLLGGASFTLYKINLLFLLGGLVLYFFVFNLFFLKRLVRYFGGDLVFPESIHLSEGIINAMIHAYSSIKRAIKDGDEKELLARTLKTRYPFMKNRKREAVLENCNNIYDLIYRVLNIELIDFDVKKVKPIQQQIDAIIDRNLKNYS